MKQDQVIKTQVFGKSVIKSFQIIIAVRLNYRFNQRKLQDFEIFQQKHFDASKKNC